MMKAAVLEEYRKPLVVRQVADPELSDDGVIVRTMANGICRSDWHVWSGHWAEWYGLPQIMGHEMSGVLEAVGRNVHTLEVGMRVAVVFCGGEGTCEQCRQGRTHLCDSPIKPGLNCPGGYGTLVHVDKAMLNVVPLPDEISFLAAAGMGCRYMTAFHGLTARAQVQPGQRVAVFGCGGIGLACIQIAAATGAEVIGVDIRQDKLDAAKEQGAVAVVDASRVQDAAREVQELTHGGADMAVDALGLESTCVPALLSLRKRGVHVQIGMTNNEQEGFIPLPVDVITASELTVLGSVGMPTVEYDGMLRLVRNGVLNPEKLVSERVPLEEASRVLESMDTFDTLGFAVIDHTLTSG